VLGDGGGVAGVELLAGGDREVLVRERQVVVAPEEVHLREEAGLVPEVHVVLLGAVEGGGGLHALGDLDAHGGLERPVLVGVREAEAAELVVVAVVAGLGAGRERRGHGEGLVVRRVGLLSYLVSRWEISKCVSQVFTFS